MLASFATARTFASLPSAPSLDRADALIREHDARLLHPHLRIDGHDAPEPRVDCTVSTVATAHANAPAAWMARASARMPAPPPGSSPPSASTHSRSRRGRASPRRSEHARTSSSAFPSSVMTVARRAVSRVRLRARASRTQARAPTPPYVPPPESCAEVDLDAPSTFVRLLDGQRHLRAVGRRRVRAARLRLRPRRERRRARRAGSTPRSSIGATTGSRSATRASPRSRTTTATSRSRRRTAASTYLDKYRRRAGQLRRRLRLPRRRRRDVEHARTSGARRARSTTRRFGMGYARVDACATAACASTRATYAPVGRRARGDRRRSSSRTRRPQPKHLRHYESGTSRGGPSRSNWIVSGVPLTSRPRERARHARRAQRHVRRGRHARRERRASSACAARTPATRSAPRRGRAERVRRLPRRSVPRRARRASRRSLHRSGRLLRRGEAPARPTRSTKRLAGRRRDAGRRRNGLGQPRMFVVRSDLGPRAGRDAQSLRFAYGYAPMGAPLRRAGRVARPAAATCARTCARDLAVTSSTSPRSTTGPIGGGALQREMAWHAAQIEASVAVRDYWERHVVPQGSAYLYLHGADGALRDLALFALPLVYTHPQLAREELRLDDGHAVRARTGASPTRSRATACSTTRSASTPSRAISISSSCGRSPSTSAHGRLAARRSWRRTGRRRRADARSVWDHVVDVGASLVRRRRHRARTGSSRVGDGDWSDGIVVRRARSRSSRIDAGRERAQHADGRRRPAARRRSRRAARRDARRRDPRARRRAAARRSPQTWNGTFFGRAYFGDDKLFHADVDQPRVAGLGAHRRHVPAPDRSRARLRRSRRSSTILRPSARRSRPADRCGRRSAACSTWGYALSDPRARVESPREEHDGGARARVPDALVRHLERPRRARLERRRSPGRGVVQPRDADDRLPGAERQPARDADLRDAPHVRRRRVGDAASSSRRTRRRGFLARHALLDLSRRGQTDRRASTARSRRRARSRCARRAATPSSARRMNGDPVAVPPQRDVGHAQPRPRRAPRSP